MGEREQRDPGRRGRADHEPLRVGLVLGGGGSVGAAYEIGALAALEHDLGWDARTADVIVGTSAGSMVGALLRLGVPATDMAALEVGGSTLDTREELVRWHRERREFLPFTLSHVLNRPRLPGPSALLGLSRLIARRGLPSLGSLSVLMPDGPETLIDDLGQFEQTLGSPWPADPLLVCTTRRRDCRRAVFGQGGRSAGLAEAVAASCAVPGYFAGVDIDGDTYVDGGVISPTNADVLARHQLDLVVVVSPMTGRARFPSVSHLIRKVCRKALDRELGVLRRRGIATVVIEPGAEVLEHMSNDFMDETSTLQVVQHAFLHTGTLISDDSSLQRLRPILGGPAAGVAS